MQTVYIKFLSEADRVRGFFETRQTLAHRQFAWASLSGAARRIANARSNTKRIPPRHRYGGEGRS